MYLERHCNKCKRWSRYSHLGAPCPYCQNADPRFWFKILRNAAIVTIVILFFGFLAGHFN